MLVGWIDGTTRAGNPEPPPLRCPLSVGQLTYPLADAAALQVLTRILGLNSTVGYSEVSTHFSAYRLYCTYCNSRSCFVLLCVCEPTLSHTNLHLRLLHTSLYLPLFINQYVLITAV